MKHLITLWLFCCMLSLRAEAQITYYQVQPGEVPQEVIPWKARYQYELFKPAMVFFQSGRKGAGNMNYNAMINEMQFLAGPDTIALAQENEIRYLTISTDTFYFQKAWIHLLSSSEMSKLGERKVLAFSNREKVGGYNGISAGAAIDGVIAVDEIANLQMSMAARQVISFASFTEYYFSDRFGQFKLAGKKSLLELFGSKRPGLDAFLQEQKFDYTSRADMERIWRFINTGER